MTKLGLLTIHGMGQTKPDYADAFKKALSNRFGKTEWTNIEIRSAYYQDLLQNNQSAYFNKVSAGLDWQRLRKFVLFGFSDAASLESRKVGKNSPYYQAQERILEQFRSLYKALPPSSQIVVVAQSLGGQVLSNYLWDALHAKKPSHGIWANPPKFGDKAEEDFCRGKSIRTIFTTGCNIPIFVAGIHPKEITPIDKPTPDFEWHNYYDVDDVLGWPLQGLSDGYDLLVHDHRINSGLTPLSHTKYWTDKDFLKPLAKHLRALL